MTLHRLTAAALAGVAAIFLLIWSRAGGVEADLAVLSGLALVTAALAATRRRWATLPGGLYAFVLVFVSPLFQPFTVHHLTHPREFGLFAGTLLLEALGLVATVAGLTAVAQPPTARLPRWTQFTFTGLAGAVGGALAVGLVAPAPLAAGPPVEAARTVRFVAEDMAYAQAPERTLAGDVAITLDNRGDLEHNVAFAGVDGDDPVVEAPARTTATGSVRLEPGTHTFFCTVPGHREAGMEGRLTVGVSQEGGDRAPGDRA